MLKYITEDEKNEFVQAATAFLAVKERLELMNQQGVEALGGKPGHVPVDPRQMEMVMAPMRRLQAIIIAIYQNHQALPALRFRGSIFQLEFNQGKMGVKVMRDQDIENID